MIGDEPLEPQGDDGATLLLYDYFKHLTTLSLVSLGGVLTIAQAKGAVTGRDLLPVVIAVAVSGIASFHAQDQIIRARLAGAPLPRVLGPIRLIATIALGVGVGLFLTVFLKVLG